MKRTCMIRNTRSPVDVHGRLLASTQLMMAALLSSKIGKHGTPCDMLTRRAPPPIMAAVSAAILLMSRSRASSTRRLILGMLTIDNRSDSESRGRDDESRRAAAVPHRTPKQGSPSKLMKPSELSGEIIQTAVPCCVVVLLPCSRLERVSHHESTSLEEPRPSTA